ncbi:hypothetical protein Misp06_01914 [Microbulbifer sp. NBRC 101763]|uniref:transglutaminase domain-containing protein n=1 Tax=Microbulbifer TaxID=48073 RepID=UPI0003A53ABE|nr:MULTISPECIES: transglutaminase domain-containing protein [Microbulbifer]WHI51215.1 transglutaminase domain-containing protein [Microbulbifer sp. MLAF003]
MKIQFIRIIILLIMMLGLAACAVQPSITDSLPPQNFTKENLLSGAVLLGHPVSDTDLPDIDILAVNDEMRLLLGSVDGVTDSDRLNTLVGSLQGNNFSIYYDADATLEASKVFEEQRGNCMAFSAFMVAMARELDIDIKFNEVFIPETRYFEGQHTFVYQHINVIADVGNEHRVLDFNFVDYTPAYRQKTLGDDEAFARFYSNLAMDFLSKRDINRAFIYLRKALSLSPDASDLWNNLGAIYRSAGYSDQAVDAYGVSLGLDNTNLIALSNLERALRNRSDFDLANILSERLQGYREQNPYYWYGMALAAYKQEHFELALKRAKDAISLERADHRFHFLLGMARFKVGDGGYRKSFRQALTLSVTDGDQERYRKKLDTLGIRDIKPVSSIGRVRHPETTRPWWWNP